MARIPTGLSPKIRDNNSNDKGTQITAVRVKFVSLNGSDYPITWEKYGEYNSVGGILFENLEQYDHSENVIVELLETEEISDFDLLCSFIKKVKNYGAKVAIDDFGSGYSNFNYIINLDVDIIKLDSCLIENMYTNQHAIIVVSNIIKIIKELNLEVVAEKVFSKDIEDILTKHGVDYLQGYYIGKARKDILK